MKIYEANNAALLIWMEATGLDPKDPDILGDWNHSEYHRNIKQAQEVDPTALTTFMVLRSTVREFAKDQEFDGLELLEEPEKVLARTEKLRRLLKILNDPECMAEVASFQKKLKDAAKTMGLLETCQSMIDNIQELAYIRRDALLGFKDLKVFHFGYGPRRPNPPKYNQSVIKFWNMNSVVQAAQAQPVDAITMVMVRDPVDLFSYFCFLVVNGENITVLSDLPDSPHPLHKYMSRSRAMERRFESRAMQLRFPYQLFDFKFNDDGRYTGEKQKNSLARTNIEAVLVKPVKDLDADQALWALMMFDLLAEQYWNQKQKPVELSYTGDGMKQLSLKGSESKSLVLPGQALLAPLTREDMRRENLKEVFEEPTGQNDWMEERYGKSVPEEVFNLIGEKKTYRLLDGSGTKPGKMVPKTTDVGAVFNTNTFGWKNKSWELTAIEPTHFGTPKEMESDRRFMARVNQAIVIEAAATKEFHARETEIKRWYEEKVKENLEKLLYHTALGKFDSEKQDHPPSKDGEFVSGFAPLVLQPGNILYQYGSKSAHGWGHQVKLYTMTRTRYLCHLSGKQATVWTRFSPMTPRSLADMAGCKMEELPDVLHHWYRNEQYYGNSILDRIDPMEWKCTNPWRSLKFEVLIGLAKSEFNRLLKKHGMKRREVKDIDSEERS